MIVLCDHVDSTADEKTCLAAIVLKQTTPVCCSMITPFVSFVSAPEKTETNINLYGAITNQGFSPRKIPYRIHISNYYPSNHFPFNKKSAWGGYKPNQGVYTLYVGSVERFFILMSQV